MKVISAGRFKYNRRDIRPNDEVDMTPTEYAEFLYLGLVRRVVDPPKDEQPRGTYRRRDMRADG